MYSPCDVRNAYPSFRLKAYKSGGYALPTMSLVHSASFRPPPPGLKSCSGTMDETRETLEHVARSAKKLVEDKQVTGGRDQSVQRVVMGI